MSRTPRYVVRVGDYTLEQINSLKLRFSMRELADSFSITVSDKVDIPAGEQIGIAVEGRIVLVGDVQTVRESKSAGARDLTITGFSSAQRLVKSSVLTERRTLTGFNLEQIVKRIVEPFGLVVDVAESAREIANEEIENVRIDSGQTAAAFLSEVCDRQGCILLSGAASVTPERQAKASVRISRVGVRKAPVLIVYGTPRVLSIEYEDDVRMVHSEYRVTRRGKGVLEDDGTLSVEEGIAFDERVPYSPKIFQAKKGGRSKAALQRQAEWQMRKAAGEGQRVSTTMDGWSPNDGQALWWPNTLYRVVDPDKGFDEELLLTSADMTVDAGGGSLARLEFSPPDAYAILKKDKIPAGRRGYRTDPAWLAQHSEFATELAASSDTVSLDKKAEQLIFTPPDPDA